jgi:hypothetical protein
MALPKIGIPYYPLDLISGKRIQFRAFTVREEKALLLANESKDQNTISHAIKNALNSCILPEEGEAKITVEDLPMFDVELLFLNIRMRSVGELSEFNYTCETCEGSPEIRTNLDLRNIRIENASHGENEKLMLNEDVGIEVRYPPFRVFLAKKNIGMESNSLIAIDMISDCIVSVFDKEQVYTRKDFSEREIKDFVDGLTQEQLKKVNEFFEKMPKLVYDLKIQCPCGTVEEKTLQGISDFFS